MVLLGLFDLSLGLLYTPQQKSRGSGIFLACAGGALVMAGVLIRRSENKRAEAALKPKTATTKGGPRRIVRKKATPPEPVRARGPKAGGGHRLAGPARERATLEAPKVPSDRLAERLFGGKKGDG